MLDKRGTVMPEPDWLDAIEMIAIVDNRLKGKKVKGKGKETVRKMKKWRDAFRGKILY